MASQTTVARHASFLAFLHLARSVENLALILTDSLPNSVEFFTFLLALTAWRRGCDDVPNEYVIVVSKTKLAGSIIIQNTRHEITRWWRPPASMGKVLTYLWPNWWAHARSVLPRWPPWLFRSRFDSRCLGKVPRLLTFCRFWQFSPVISISFHFCQVLINYNK